MPRVGEAEWSRFVLDIKLRAGLLVALGAVMLLGSLSASPAFAEGGPFCHHRAIGSEKDNGKITEAEPEEFDGGGGEQALAGKILGSAITIASKQAQVKGIIYNNPDQCQLKILIDYVEPHVTAPASFTGCEVKINTQNSVKLFGHQAWKWAGSKTELEEKEPGKIQHRDWIFLPVELQQGAKELPKTEVPFAILTLSKKGTGTCELAKTTEANVTGSASGEGFHLTSGGEPKQALEEFGTEEEISTTLNGGRGPQKFWNGSLPWIGVQTGLEFAGAAATYKGAFKTKTLGRQQGAAQEIAYFEK
jgi:hypothetical protein